MKPTIVWVENPSTPTRSGVWRYNQTLLRELNNDARIEIVISGTRRQVPNVVDLSLASMEGRPQGSGFVPKPLRPFVRFAASVARITGFGTLALFAPPPLPPPVPNQIVHLTDQYLASRLTFVKRRPLVITVHDIIPFLSRQQLGINLYVRRMHGAVYRTAVRNLRKASAIITVSEFTKQTLLANTSLPPDRIHAVHSAVDHQRFFPGPVSDGFWDRFNLPRERPIVLHVSNEAPHKNFSLVLKAFAEVRSEISDALLVKVGIAHSSRQRDLHLDLIDQLGIAADVRFLEDANDSEIVDAYRAASVLTMPSLAEGFGLPILEAMACGTVVISSVEWALPEIVGEAGILLDPYDHQAWASTMVRVLKNRDFASSFRSKGIARAKAFTWSRTARETVDTYLKVAQEII